MFFAPIRRSFDQFAQRVAGMSETRANRRAARVSDLAMGAVLIAVGMRLERTHWALALVAMLAGLGLFTLVEYVFHRWMFHGGVPLFAPGHRRHHEHPTGDDAMPFFLPPLALLAIVALLALVMPAGLAWAQTGGLAAGYALYGLSHDIIHSTRFRHPLSRRWAASHHIHHFHPDRNFGVTSPLWDIVFGTRHQSKGSGRQ
jgi:sterol desaturase/sphingolipid hydroxylase (fatty acid hydroxylase superfamily)